VIGFTYFATRFDMGFIRSAIGSYMWLEGTGEKPIGIALGDTDRRDD